MPPKLRWKRHCILRSHEQTSVEYHGLVFFADGSLVCPPGRGFARGEAIQNQQVGELLLSRHRGCELLRLELPRRGEVHWFEFEMGAYTKWHHVLPVGRVGRGDRPTPLEQPSDLWVGVQRAFIGFGYGLRNQTPPSF